MARALPLSPEFRESFILLIDQVLDGKDPADFFGRHVFDGRSHHWSRIPHEKGTTLDLYRNVLQYCELSAWSEDPPLIISLLQAFQQFAPQDDLIERIQTEGPFRCHPPGLPLYVARISERELLLDRQTARGAALGFDPETPQALLLKMKSKVRDKRVLLVKGESHPGLPSTLDFFRYLAAIQPSKTGVLYVDAGNQELLTQAASSNTSIELLIARDLEQQIRRVREEFDRSDDDDSGDIVVPERPFTFQPLTDLEQRTRWTRRLAEDFVDRVLYRVDGNPQWWVTIFANCSKAPADAQEFVRRLVELAAGTGLEDVDKALKRQLRIVLLDGGQTMLPSPLYDFHVLEEDLTQSQPGLPELVTYFRNLAASLGLLLSKQQADAMAQSTLDRAQQLLGESSPPPALIDCIVRAALEQTSGLEAQASQKGAKP